MSICDLRGASGQDLGIPGTMLRDDKLNNSSDSK